MRDACGAASVLASAWHRQSRFDALRGAHRVMLALPDGTTIELARGRLVAPQARAPGGDGDLAGTFAVVMAAAGPGPPPGDGPLPCDLADEFDVVGAWLERGADQARLVHVDGELATPVPWLVHVDGEVVTPGPWLEPGAPPPPAMLGRAPPVGARGR